jgi:hypothetical protein
MTEMHRIQEEHRGRRQRRRGPSLIVPVLVAVVSMALAGPALAGRTLTTVTRVEPSVGPAAGGTSVTITGTGFKGVTAVRFGSTNATSVTVNSETQITAVSPPGSGVVDVTVTTRKATSPTSTADQFAYGPPAPTVTKVEPKEGYIEGGTLVTITGTNLSGATAVMFGSNNATTFAVNSETSINAVSPGGGISVNVTVTTNPGGTSAISPADEFTYFRGCETAQRPEVTSVEPNLGPAGTTVKVTGLHFFEVVCGVGNNVNRIIFGPQVASFTAGEHEGEEIATAPPGTGTVDVRVEMDLGRTSPISSADKFTY